MNMASYWVCLTRQWFNICVKWRSIKLRENIASEVVEPKEACLKEIKSKQNSNWQWKIFNNEQTYNMKKIWSQRGFPRKWIDRHTKKVSKPRKVGEKYSRNFKPNCLKGFESLQS